MMQLGGISASVVDVCVRYVPHEDILGHVAHRRRRFITFLLGSSIGAMRRQMFLHFFLCLTFEGPGTSPKSTPAPSIESLAS